ncbi:transcription initiation factor TFIID subunit 7-like [Nycticebus coucang]|uniref:transcription initiation factor TFIID subunit 7-like n=1 Tax=Nycticebus coucang TaxID=9470 RepID=UPI00234E2FF2|nr:transcription initiation factor TFIID subunit 7-like [Nycticebus coucang]
MERPEVQLPDSSQSDSTVTTTTPDIIIYEEHQIRSARGAESACVSIVETAEEDGVQFPDSQGGDIPVGQDAPIPVSEGAPTDADNGARAAAATPGNLPEGTQPRFCFPSSVTVACPPRSAFQMFPPHTWRDLEAAGLSVLLGGWGGVAGRGGAGAGRSYLSLPGPPQNPQGRDTAPGPHSLSHGGASPRRSRNFYQLCVQALAQERSQTQDEPPHELENQFILRLPLEQAYNVRSLIHSGSVAMKDKLKIDLSPAERRAIVQVEDVSLSAKLVDLPCVIGSLKSLDKKTFYKTADVSQMLLCSAEDDVHSSPEEPVTSTDVKTTKKNERENQKKYLWKHGITPPLKNVRKRRFRKVTRKPPDCKQIEEINFAEFTDSPDVEKEVKRLLCSDAEAICARWEVIAEDETKEIESQGSIPGFVLSPGYERAPISVEYDMLREMLSDSSSTSDNDDDDNDDNDDDDDDDDEDEDEDEEVEEECEEDLERELQAKFLEFGQYEAKEGASSVVFEIQKQIHYVEKSLCVIQRKIQRQKDLIMKVENLTLKNHLHSMLKQLELQESQKTEQLTSLQEQLKQYLK